jgi:chromate transporter
MPLLIDLLLHFMLMSLMAIGGANATIGEMHRYLVESRGWISSTEFSSLYAISQAAPGPNMLCVALFGWHIAGIAGAVLATLGMCGPSSILVLSFEIAAGKTREARWPLVIRRGLAPISVGLMLATGWLLAYGADIGWADITLTCVCIIVMLKTRLSPLWLIALGALAGGLGVLG